MEYSKRASYANKSIIKGALEAALAELDNFPDKRGISFSISMSETEENNNKNDLNYILLGKAAVDIAHFVPTLVKDKDEKDLVKPFFEHLHKATGKFLGTPRVESSVKRELKELAKKK